MSSDLGHVQLQRSAKDAYLQVLHQQELYWKQRAKQYWLRDDGSNIRYFHVMASAQRKKNSISQLKDTIGDWVTWQTGLQEVVRSYFDNLFTSSPGKWI